MTHDRWMVVATMGLAAMLGNLGCAGSVSQNGDHAVRSADPYENYVDTSKDFKAVKQDKDWALKAFPGWTYMPWYYQWTIGHGTAAGEFCQNNGINGAFLNNGHADYLGWVDKYQLRFYMDHTASKGYLHLWDGSLSERHKNQVHGGGVRVKPVNADMVAKLEGIIRKNVTAVKESPMRGAYALDDEISWGHFVHPCMWCITDDTAAFPAWLKEIYGADHVPPRTGWITYNDIQSKLHQWKIKDFDASQLMDQWTFNDSYWNNFLGDLVTFANSVDPATPCGFVGGQNASAFGGYDYAKVMRKVQFLESYAAGGIIRSFNPKNALPTVTTHFFKSVNDTIWQVWYNLAHGNKGHIGWVEGWFNGTTPKPWIAQVAPSYFEAGKKIGPLMSGAEWKHDGVAVYYSHASIQLGWILDAEAHGKTWINRNGDGALGASHLVRNAWENMLRDEGLQYNFISYVDVIQHGIPKEYKVLILPACLCLSDAEARQIKAFCAAGGTVVADYMPGLWDQHGKGRAAGGVLDDMFGVKHDPNMGCADVFQGGKLWAEVDQEAHFGYRSQADFLSDNTCIKDASGFNKAVRNMGVANVNHFGQGTAMLLNLSPQWYNAYRGGPCADATAKRQAFMQPVKQALPDGGRWVKIENAGDKENGYEITYWTKGPRTILFLCYKPEITAGSLGGGNSVGLKSDLIPVTLAFQQAIHNVRDERADKNLDDGTQFKLDWKMNEAVVLSFDTPK